MPQWATTFYTRYKPNPPKFRRKLGSKRGAAEQALAWVDDWFYGDMQNNYGATFTIPQFQAEHRRRVANNELKPYNERALRDLIRYLFEMGYLAKSADGQNWYQCYQGVPKAITVDAPDEPNAEYSDEALAASEERLNKILAEQERRRAELQEKHKTTEGNLEVLEKMDEEYETLNYYRNFNKKNKE